jgi:predicted PurR-regulated permease PerM
MAPGRRSRSVEHCNEDSEEATMATSDTGAGALQKGGEKKNGSSRILRIRVDSRSIWQMIGAVLLTLAGLWAMGQMRSLLWMLILSFFFSLALQPAVNWLVQRYGWRRGSSVGAIYGIGLLAGALLILIIIPAIAQLAQTIGESGSEWIASGSAWLSDTFGIEFPSPGTGEDIAQDASQILEDWAKGAVGNLVGIATTGVTFIFNLATIAMFTFYFTADAPRFQKTVLSHMSPESQKRVGWTWDEAIRQTGGYFYSRSLLMLINSTGFFFTMVLVGMPVAFAIPLAIFGGFVSVFIPAIGTYIGAAIPILVTLAIQGWVAALVVLGYALIYQQIENYWLSPKISSKTMSLNGAVAFGAALAGGAIAGPMGAFMALPVAALIMSFASNFSRSYEVVYHSPNDNTDHVGTGSEAAEGSAATAT